MRASCTHVHALHEGVLGVHNRSHARSIVAIAKNGSRIDCAQKPRGLQTMAGTIGATLLADLRHTNDFLNQQRNILSDAGFRETLEGQTKMFETRMIAAQGRVGPEQAREISELISGGPWTAPLKERLGAALNRSLLAAEAPEMQGSSPKRVSQECFSFARYLTAKDLEVLASDCANSTKVETLMLRMDKVGLHLPTERTYGSIIGSLPALGARVDQQTSEMLLQDLKRRLRSHLKHRPRLPPSLHVVRYPDSPDGLPSDLYNRAYSGDDLPIGKDVQPDYIRMRKRKSDPEKPSSSMAMSSNVNPMDLMVQFMQTMMQNNSSNSGINLQMNLPRKRQKALEDHASTSTPQQLALEDKKADDKKADNMRADDMKEGDQKEDQKNKVKGNVEDADLFDLEVGTAKPANAQEHMDSAANAMQKRAEAKEAEKITTPKAKGKAAAKGKAKAKSHPLQKAPCAKSKAKAKAEAPTIAKRPAGSPNPPGGLKLGCMKCRGAAKGCVQCRRSDYSGRRVTRQEWNVISATEGYK